MPAIRVSAPAKTILVGEHAVVYNQPAIAFPVNQIQAKTTIIANPLGKGDEIIFDAGDIQFRKEFKEIEKDHPFKGAVELIKKEANLSAYPACTIRINSTIPIASGLGSSAAVSVSLIKGLSEFIGLRLAKQKLADLAYEIEVKYHGTPSGIDNTVIVFNQPVFFIKGQGFHLINPKDDFIIVIANSGIPGNTKKAVAGVRAKWQQNPAEYDNFFAQIGKIVREAEITIESGDWQQLGKLMTANHEVLTQIGVSHPKLDTMVAAAMNGGALGAKLSGGGLGGNMIALSTPETTESIIHQLKIAGSVSFLLETIKKGKDE
jgi:mevalonate kinase